GLQYERAARSDRRRYLVRDQVEGEVERRDEAADTDRDAPRHAAVATGALGDAQLDHLPIDAGRLASRDAEGIDQPGHLAACVTDRLAGLDAQRMRKLLAPRLELPDAVEQHVAARVGREVGHR